MYKTKKRIFMDTLIVLIIITFMCFFESIMNYIIK